MNDIELMEAFTQKSLHLAAEVKHREQSVHVGWMIFVQALEVLSINLGFKNLRCWSALHIFNV